MSVRGAGLAGARRRFLQVAAASGAGAALSLSPLGRLLAAAGDPQRGEHGYGPLAPVPDLATGLPLLALPSGFSYLSFGWTGEPLADGTPTPRAHDGMGIVHADGEVLTLVRNHELVHIGGAFGPAQIAYDPVCAGGTVSLRFDTARRRVLEAWPSLSGTLQNCAGGVTPWGTWLSCEEFVAPAGVQGGGSGTLQHEHGFVFEVPATGTATPRPLRALGQFCHEAACVHAPSGIVYMTEDVGEADGFYRFVPERRGSLAAGRLQMLRVAGRQDLRGELPPGEPMAADWVDIQEPGQGVVGLGVRGVQAQGFASGAACFTRLEGIFAGPDEVFFTSTDGGPAGCGQVFVYRPERAELVLVHASTDPAVLDYPDNVCLSPRGGLVLCQDARSRVQHLHGLTRAGAVFEFARNNVVLDGERGFTGDFRGSEWAGACFSPDGRWLFANIYSPGFSVAITGPWREGLI